MKHKFLLGAISGISALALAVPIAVQISSAASSSPGTGDAMFKMRGPLTQEHIQAMIDRDSAFLTNADAMLATLKGATQTHKDALSSAVTITDETERQTAVQKAQEDFHTTIKTAIDANPDLKGVMMPFGPMGARGHHGRGMKMHGGKMLEKLGMTPEELKAAIDSGKTIEQIAEDKGITLPEHPFMMKFEQRLDQSNSSAQ